MMKMISQAGGYLLQPSHYQFGVLNSANVGRDAEVYLSSPRTLSSKNIQSSTIPSMPSLWAQEELDLELPSVLSSKDSKQLAYPSYSPQDHILWQLKEVSTQP